MVLFNFRADRMVEISKAFEYEDFNAFDRKRFPKVTLLTDMPLTCPFTIRHAAIHHVDAQLNTVEAKCAN